MYVCIQGVKEFTLTLANVEWIAEEDTFIRLRCCEDIHIVGPLALDGDPLRFCQCEIIGTDGATWLDVRVMPGYAGPFCRMWILLHHASPTLSRYATGTGGDLNCCLEQDRRGAWGAQRLVTMAIDSHAPLMQQAQSTEGVA